MSVLIFIDQSEGHIKKATFEAISYGSKLAEQLGTTAEGIETEEQLSLVKALGCSEMQGYLFGVPMPVEEIVQLFPRAADRRASAA
jgi:EAL domain-containing protein (putative c-di-GMP-specific phosphodiesterase class I)